MEGKIYMVWSDGFEVSGSAAKCNGLCLLYIISLYGLGIIRDYLIIYVYLMNATMFKLSSWCGYPLSVAF